MSFDEKLMYFLRAGQPGLYINTQDEARTVRTIQDTARTISEKYPSGGEYVIASWNVAEGLQFKTGEKVYSDPETRSPYKFLEEIRRLKNDEAFIFLAKDFHLFPIDTDPLLNRATKETIRILKESGGHFVILAPTVKLPVEWEKVMVVMEHPLLSRDELEAQAGAFVTSSLIKQHTDVIRAMEDLGLEPDIGVEEVGDDSWMAKTNVTGEDLASVAILYDREDGLRTEDPKDHKVLDRIQRQVAINYMGQEAFSRLPDAAAGFIAEEFETAMSLSQVELGRIDPERIMKLKAEAVKKTGTVELIEHGETLRNLGGNENLKAWFNLRVSAFTKEAREFGIPNPRGVLLAGVQGCGKSLSAKVAAACLGLPLLRWNVDRMFASLVGKSEENFARARQISEALAPCVVWIDEVEKAFGNQSDTSGVSQRIFGAMLTWMQEKTAPVFLFATCNNWEKLPPEFCRKGRWDEVFFVDLPTESERDQIVKIHLQKRGRNPELFDTDVIARAAKEFSGAEIEESIIEALYTAFDQNRELQQKDILTAVGKTVPLATQSRDVIRKIQEWGQANARNASEGDYAERKGRVIRD